MGTCSSVYPENTIPRNAEGVHGQTKVRTPGLDNYLRASGFLGIVWGSGLESFFHIMVETYTLIVRVGTDTVLRSSFSEF